MNRKDFLISCGGLCAAFAGISLVSSCGGIHQVQATAAGAILSVSKEEFKLVKDGQTNWRKMILVRSARTNFPIALFRLSESDYSALLMECTHQGCELNPAGDFLVCPCHGSEFDKAGRVQNPPAEQNLKRFKTSSDEKTITIHTDSYVS
ncbi:MAG: Rieske Fe-S protein [Bacteroidetes bacterium]|nr:MAG: Rieske Fe-S protein [Bacteroidota bacterium]